jgi:hypothetical protein
MSSFAASSFASAALSSMWRVMVSSPDSTDLPALSGGVCAISDGVRELGLEIRAGLHTGECEIVDEKVGGIAVHIGARVAKEAHPGEVLVSSTVRDSLPGQVFASASAGRPS